MEWSATELVRIEIWAPEEPEAIKEFLQWQLQTKNYSIADAGQSGGGACVLYFRPEQAEAVRAWLREREANLKREGANDDGEKNGDG